jgi:glycosyltransferase involved in cell wall biosynthesis
VVIANGAPPAKVSLSRLGHHLVVERKAGPAERPTAAPVRVGYLGRFEDVKGVHDLARALVHLPRSVAIQVEFRGPDSHDAERRVLSEVRAIVGGDPRCKFAPAVAADQVPGVLAGYDVLCCPAVCLEGGPTVAIEAHAVGTPVIGTCIGGLAEMVSDGVNGRLVPPGDWKALAEVLQGIAADPAGTVDRWRGALPVTRTMNDVAADYERTYARLHESRVAAL